jgi:hypothetical protein
MDIWKPWMYKPDEADPDVRRAKVQENANPALYQVGEALRISSILLQPVIPGKAAEALDRLGVAPERRTAEYAVFGADFAYGRERQPWDVQAGVGAAKPLFNKKMILEPEPPSDEEKARRARRREAARKPVEVEVDFKRSEFMAMVGKIKEAVEAKRDSSGAKG